MLNLPLLKYKGFLIKNLGKESPFPMQEMGIDLWVEEDPGEGNLPNPVFLPGERWPEEPGGL